MKQPNDKAIEQYMADPESVPPKTEDVVAAKARTQSAIDSAVFGSRECLEFDIIGALLVDGSRIDADGVTAELFTGAYRIIYDACKACKDRLEGYDLATVYSELGPTKMRAIGGMTFFNTITSEAGIPSAIPHNVKALQRFIRRDATAEIAKQLAVGVDDDDEIIRKTISDLQNIGVEEDNTKHVSDIVSVALESMLTPGEKGFSSGMSGLDKTVGGISKLFSVIAARPGMGKSTFLINLAVNFALAGKRVMIWSGEDSQSQMTERFISRLSAGDNAQQSVHGATKLKELPIWMNDKSGISGSELSALCHDRKRQHGIDVVIVDHLGKIREKGDNLYHKTSAVSAALADMQLSLGVPVIAACQLRRGAPGDTKMPGLEDLRDSGWVEADARQVIILNRPYYFWQTGQVKDQPPKNEMFINVAKNNHGPTAVVKAYCEMSRYYIGDSPDHTDEPRKGWADDY